MEVAAATSPPPSSSSGTEQVVKVLEALKQASHDLSHSSSSSAAATSSSSSPSSSSLRALLELSEPSTSILSSDPYLSTLSRHLSYLKEIVETFEESVSKKKQGRVRSFLMKRVSRHEIARVAGSIESEIQAWIDRENVENLVSVLTSQSNEDEGVMVQTLARFVARLAEGFNKDLQDLLLKAKVFSLLESILCNSTYSTKLREQVAFTVAELINFNKDVFVGQVLMGESINALISMASPSSLKVLCLLIKSIKSPLVDEIDSNNEICDIVDFLTKTEDLSIRVMAMNCLLEIGYFGRKEAVEAMLKANVIHKLVELQRSELGGDLIEMGKWEEKEEEKGGRRGREKRFLECHPFASCVARFAVQLEVGEGLRQREKRAFKLEVLKRVKEACVSDAEAATIAAEVLWGSSP